MVRESLKGLDPVLENKIQYKWIHQRIRSMENIWVKAGRSLSAKYNLAGRKAKQVMPPSSLFILFYFFNLNK